MAEVGAGQVIYELRKNIQHITSELKIFDTNSTELPELIKSANLLRSNEHLLWVNFKQSELISVYEQYSYELEKMLKTVFEIQKDLKEILKTQTSLISKQKKAKPKTKKNS